MKYKDVVNIAAEPVKDNKGPIILGLLALLGVMAVIFISNLLGWFWPMVVLMLASLVLVTMVGFKAEILVNFAFFGAFIHLLQDKDKSQGAAQGLKWLTEIVIAVGFGFYFFTFTLLTWDFSNYPGAYWVFFFGIVLLKLVDAHYKIPTSWAPKAIKAYIGICIVVVGVRTITGVYPDVNFTNGEAVTMVHSVTRDPVKGYSPEMCRSEYIEGVLIEYPAKGFDYATMSTCRDPHDNARIVPITTEDVQRQNAKTWGSTVNGAVSKHPAISWVEERIHMPWWVAGLIVVGTIVVWRIIPRKKKSGSDSKEESKDYGINLAAVIVALGFSSLLAAVAVIALNVAGVMNGLSFSTAVAMADSCATPASVEHYKFDERGRTLTICQGGEELQLYPKVAGKPLIISLVTNTDDEKYYLAGKYPEEFVNFLYPWQVPGSTQNIHRLTPKPRQKADEEGPIEAVALAMGQPGVRFLIRQQR